jgi:hypothetical protein
MSKFSQLHARVLFVVLVALCGLLISSVAHAQTTVAQGSIQGTITDPSGAVVSGAKISIIHKATGQSSTTTTSSSGTYNSGGLIPGDYTVRVQAPGFKTVEVATVVQVAVTTSGNIKLELGQGSTVVEVQGAAITVNTEQATVQGVLTGEQIDNLPVNGRNFLDLAQLEPGVQMQDGTSFDPTKAGYSSVSINGMFGRTPRIEVDGLDVSDETVGTTTQNIAMSSIQEFNISRSNLDLSTEVTGSGAINLATRSGTNAIHGQAFGLFRDNNAGFAAFPGSEYLPFERSNFGGRVGGPIVKDRIFFFADSERIKQDSLNPVITFAPFTDLSGGYSSPFRSTSSEGKIDIQATKDIHVFVKSAYDVNYSNSNAFAGDYSIYSNRDNTFQHAVGMDWNKGSWSHTFRAGYLKFHNLIGDGTASLPSALNPFPSIEVLFADNGLFTGPNFLAPQQTYQSNKQFKYDGSKVWGSHILRMGVGVNRILGGGFASFFGFGPLTITAVDGAALGLPTTGAGFQCDPSSGTCPSDPGAYPLIALNTIGNGQGYFTEHPQFGAPAGGQADTRFETYFGDSWKIKPNLTLTYGLRYLHDTGRTDSDLAPIPCSATTLITCSGNLLDQFGNQPGLGNRIRNPNENFGPQVGFAWDPKHDGKTVIRGGGGVFYENSIFNNVLFDRPGKLASGLFFGTTSLNCSPGAGVGTEGLTLPNGTFLSSIDGADIATQLCFQPLGASAGSTTVAGAAGDLQKAYQAAVAAAGPASNGNFVGNTLEFDSALEGYAVYAPNYRPTRSYQMNIGIQHEIVRGGVLTVDYIRNLNEHFPLTYDVNHVGDSRWLNTAAALNAIATTTGNGPTGFGCGGGTDSASIQCAINAGATINNFAANGLDSGVAFLNGLGAPVFGLNPSAGQGAAFGGINPNVGVGDFQFPVGHSAYNGLQTEYKQDVRNPMRGVNGMNLQFAYTLSSFNGNGGNDQNFSAVSFDQRDPAGTYGPTTLDRRHQFKLGTTFDIAHHGPRLSLIGGFLSPRPSNLALEITGGGGQNTVADIYRTDLNGDGTVGDLSNQANGGAGKTGTFQREVSAKNLGTYINNFNTNYGNGSTLTPAGQALVSAGLFSQSQLVSLGAVISPITPLSGPVPGNPWYKDIDSVVSWPIRIRERLTIEPSVGFFNLFNFANFAPLAGTFTAAPGSVNGTVTNDDYNSRNAVRSGLGSGVFAPGAPRQAEFGLRIDF